MAVFSCYSSHRTNGKRRGKTDMTVARGGRLPDAIDAAMERLNTSVDVDWELWREDIAGSIAHAEGLARAGVLESGEAVAIVSGLEQIKAEIERGEFVW